MQICRTCDIEKPWESFAINRSYKTGRATQCKLCANLAATLRYRCPIKRLMWKFKISEELANQLRENTLCSLCGNPQVEQKALAVDHCHKTGKIRGTLCDLCNKGLGQFKDNIALLQKAIHYLESYD